MTALSPWIRWKGASRGSPRGAGHSRMEPATPGPHGVRPPGGQPGGLRLPAHRLDRLLPRHRARCGPAGWCGARLADPGPQPRLARRREGKGLGVEHAARPRGHWRVHLCRRPAAGITAAFGVDSLAMRERVFRRLGLQARGHTDSLEWNGAVAVGNEVPSRLVGGGRWWHHSKDQQFAVDTFEARLAERIWRLDAPGRDHLLRLGAVAHAGDIGDGRRVRR